MAMSIVKLRPLINNLNYNNSEFKNTVENHLQILINTAKVKAVEVTGAQEVRHRGDFYALLNEILVPQDLHWIILRLNGMNSPMEYQGNLETVLIPDNSFLEFLLRRFMNRKRYV